MNNKFFFGSPLFPDDRVPRRVWRVWRVLGPRTGPESGALGGLGVTAVSSGRPGAGLLSAVGPSGPMETRCHSDGGPELAVV